MRMRMVRDPRCALCSFAFHDPTNTATHSMPHHTHTHTFSLYGSFDIVYSFAQSVEFIKSYVMNLAEIEPNQEEIFLWLEILHNDERNFELNVESWSSLMRASVVSIRHFPRRALQAKWFCDPCVVVNVIRWNSCASILDYFRIKLWNGAQCIYTKRAAPSYNEISGYNEFNGTNGASSNSIQSPRKQAEIPRTHELSRKHKRATRIVQFKDLRRYIYGTVCDSRTNEPKSMCHKLQPFPCRIRRADLCRWVPYNAGARLMKWHKHIVNS